MPSKLLILSVFSSFLLSSSVWAQAPENFNEAEIQSTSSSTKAGVEVDDKMLKYKLQILLRQEISSVKTTAMPNLLEVLSEQGISYVSRDGEFFIQGTLFGIGEDIQNYTENSMVELRKAGVKKFDAHMIKYPAKDEKHVVTVFTDITCGYCRKMHQQMEEYNELGITIQYLAYPRYGVYDRSGKHTQSFADLRSIWCHEKPDEALTKAKNGRTVAHRICEAPIEDELNFGRQAGVSGTPALVFADGSLTSGYQPPEALLQTIKSKGL